MSKPGGDQGGDTPVTTLLADWSNGNERALEALIPIVFDDLRAMAARIFQKESPAHTLQPTALVSEVYFRLNSSRKATWKSSDEFFQFAATIMRRVLVDYARMKQTEKRGAGHEILSASSELIHHPVFPAYFSPNILDVDRAIKKLSRLDSRAAKIVRYRYFLGLTVREIAEVTGVTERTVRRDWSISRRFLEAQLKK